MLTDAQRAQLADDGYVVADGLLDAGEVFDPVLADYSAVLDAVEADLVERGLPRRVGAGAFQPRLLAAVRQSGQNLVDCFDITFGSPQRARGFLPSIFRLLTAPGLLRAVQELIGPDVYLTPQQHVRIKFPDGTLSGELGGLAGPVPWHQDIGFLLPEADGTNVVTAWIPVVPATLDNGCLEVIPGSHRGGLLQHCPYPGGLHIPEGLVQGRQAVPVPIDPGSVLFLDRRTVHRSRTNSTEDEVRVSFDCRFQPPGQPTGRPALPGFLVAGGDGAAGVVTEAETWIRRWEEERSRLLRNPERPAGHRWSGGEEICA